MRAVLEAKWDTFTSNSACVKCLQSIAASALELHEDYGDASELERVRQACRALAARASAMGERGLITAQDAKTVHSMLHDTPGIGLDALK